MQKATFAVPKDARLSYLTAHVRKKSIIINARLSHCVRKRPCRRPINSDPLADWPLHATDAKFALVSQS